MSGNSYTNGYEVKILFEGYSNAVEGATKANCTCTLLKGTKNIIVDTMTAWDGPKLQAALKAESLDCWNIDWVICTHGHSDHIGCNYLFPNAMHIVGNSISKKDIYLDFNFKSEDYVIDEFIKVTRTPGHTMQDVTVLVDTDKGVVAITGDLFEKKEDLVDSSIWKDAGSDDEVLQDKYRTYILSFADYIVPGHGPMFKNYKKIMEG